MSSNRHASSPSPRQMSSSASVRLRSDAAGSSQATLMAWFQPTICGCTTGLLSSQARESTATGAAQESLWGHSRNGASRGTPTEASAAAGARNTKAERWR